MGGQPDEFDKWQAAWLAKAAERGHTLKVYGDGDLDIDLFAGASHGIHNGPLCERCQWSTCMHCNADPEAIPVCNPSKRDHHDQG